LFRQRVIEEVPVVGTSRTITAEGLFREHGTFAWRVLRRLGVPDADVDDVCQEVFVVVHRRIAAFEGRSSTRTWVYGICVRAAANHRRRGPGRREVLSDRPPEGTIDAPQEDNTALRQARAVLDRILDELDDDRRAVFVLYEIEELGMSEVASALGCPLQTAYSRLHAARRDVEAAMARLRPSEEGR
jgi:RNA polymerase sigma-70 factor (ECF subfamily)